MSTPYRFTPRVPAPPYPTPASASAYILPNLKAIKPPIRNPYEKFTQPEFDAWIGGITGALRRALGQDDEEAPGTKRNQDAHGEVAEGYPTYRQVGAEDSDDEPIDDSFADFKARRAGKGKARDPREGPGLGKGDSVQPIQIVSSDEEEEEEVELSIAQFDDEESEEGEEEEEEEEEEYSAEEEYAWERGQSSSKPVPSPERTRKRMSVQEEEEYEEEEEGAEEEEAEADFEEYDDDEYDEDAEEEDQARGSSPQVIELISDDEEEIPPPPISKRSGEERHHRNEEEDDLQDEDGYGSDGYAEYDEDQEDEEILSLRTNGSDLRGSDLTNVRRTEREVMDMEEQDELLEDDDEVQPIEPVDTEASPVALPPKWRRSLDIQQSRVEIPDPWEGPRTYAEDFYNGGDIRASPSKQIDASHLGPEDDVILVDTNDDHEENVENKIQPMSKFTFTDYQLPTAFPPETALPPSVTQLQSDIEIPDPWSGPRHYAQDFYSGGPLILPLNATTNPDHLGPGDSQHVDIVDVQEGVLEEEIDEENEDEIQPLNADGSFPPREEPEENLPTIPDPWEGPQLYAEDFYSGGDVRTIPGEPIDPSLLTGTGDLDDGIDAFLTPGALSPSQSERISLVTNEEEVDEDVRAPAQHYVTAPSRRSQPIPADAEFISIDDFDDEQQKEQETKLQDMHPVSEEADYTGIYDFEGSLQEATENVDENQITVVPPFGTVNQEETIANEHGDRFEELNLGEEQIFYVVKNEDSFDILTNVEDQNDFLDVSLSTFLYGMPSTSPHFTSSSPAKGLSATATRQDIASHEAQIDNAEGEPTTVKRELSQEIIHPAEVIELNIVQVDAVSEHDINPDTRIEGATISEENIVNAAVKTVSPEDAKDVSIQDQVIVEEVQDISVSEEKMISVEVTNIDMERENGAEVQDVKLEKEGIQVDEVELEATESLAGVDHGIDKEELIPDIQDTEGVQEISINLIPCSPGNLPQAEQIIEAIQEEILDDLTSSSTAQPPWEARTSEGIQEIPIGSISSTPSISRPPVHRSIEINEVLDEDASTEQPISFESVNPEVNSPNYTVREAIMDGFTDEDADGEVDQEIDIMSVAAVSDIQERLAYEEYTIEEPVTEGRLTQELSERATSLDMISVGLEEVITVILPEEDVTDDLDHISPDEAAAEATHFQDETVVPEEEALTALDRETAVKVSPEKTMIQEETSLQKTSNGESTSVSATDHIEEPQGTVKADAPEPASSELKLPNLLDRLPSASSPKRVKESTEGPASVTVCLTPPLVRTIREDTVSPTTPYRQLEPSMGTSSLTPGGIRGQVMSSITRAFFSQTLPDYFGDLNVDITSPATPPSDRNDLTIPPATIPATVSESVPVTIPDTIPEATVPAVTVPVTVPTTISTTIPAAIPATGLEAVPTAVPTTIPPALREILPPAIGATFQTASSSIAPPLPMGVSLTRPRVPVLMSDPYPYSLSTPHDSFAYLVPEEGSEEETGLDNSLSSISTLEQEKDKKGSVLDDGEDLEFQYPPEQEVIEELRKAGLPLSFLQPSKVESEISVVAVGVNPAQLDKSRLTTPTTKIAGELKREENQSDKPSPVDSAVPPSSSRAADNLSTANLPSPSLAESKPKIPTIKIPPSSKRSQKRKRDASPTPGSGQVSHIESPVGQKGKGKRVSKSERKAKSQELKELFHEPTSEETIRVRSRPNDTLTESEKLTEGAPPPFRVLQRGDRASSTVSSTPSDISAGIQQPSPTVNKPNKPPSQPLPPASLFHTHGKGRKLLMPSFLPKMVKQIQGEKSSASLASSTSRVSELLMATPASVPWVSIAASVFDIVQPPSISNNIVVRRPLTASTSTTLSVATPAPPIPIETSPAPVTPLATSPTSVVPATNPLTPSAPSAFAPVTAVANTPTQHAPHRARPSRVASMTSSPVTRSHCKYHRISLPKEEGGPRVCFLIPGCSLNDKELMEEEEIEDHGDATVEDSYRMIKDLDSLGFHSDLIGILRQLVGLDILREQEVFYLPAPGEEVFIRKNSLKKSASEKSAMVRVPAESSSYAGSPGLAASPGSWKTATPVAGSNSPSITGRRSFIDSEKGSSFAATDTEQDFSDGEEPQTKRVRPSPPEEYRPMGPPSLAQPKVKPKRIRKPKIPNPEGEVVEGSEADKAARKPRKSTTKRGVKRSRTSETVNVGEKDGRSSKKLKAHVTAPGQLSPEKPLPSS